MRSDSESSFLWVVYFFAVVVAIGIWYCPAYIPVILIAPLVPGLQRLAEVFFARSVRFMLQLQPWLTLQVRLPDPYDGKKPGVLLVSNHRSHLDVFILLAKIPGVRVLARKSLLWVLPIAPMLLVTRQILVPRGDTAAYLRAMETIRRRLRRGETVHVFPEMTRCEPGMRGTRSFSSASFLAAMQEGARIIPIVFHNTDEAWAKGRSGIKPTVVRAEMLTPIDYKNMKAGDVRDLARERINACLATALETAKEKTPS